MEVDEHEENGVETRLIYSYLEKTVSKVNGIATANQGSKYYGGKLSLIGLYIRFLNSACRQLEIYFLKDPIGLLPSESSLGLVIGDIFTRQHAAQVTVVDGKLNQTDSHRIGNIADPDITKKIRTFIRNLLDIKEFTLVSPERRAAHHCHARGCKVKTKPEMLMCKKHWFMVPKQIRVQVWATYRPGQCADMNPSEEWHKAADEAILAVARREGKVK